MKQSVSEYDFEQAFNDAGRGDQFTYYGKKALYEYLEQMGDDCGIEYELDVIALCCEFTEYETALEAAEEFGYEDEEIKQEEANLHEAQEAFNVCEAALEEIEEDELDNAQEEFDDAEELLVNAKANLDDAKVVAEERAADWLRDQTQLIEFDGGIIIQDF